jgi:hypothetical protein
MSSSHRPGTLALALAVTALAAAPGTAVAMPAGPDPPAGDVTVALQPEPLARVAAPPQADGEDVAVLLAAGAFAIVAAGGVAFAHRHPHPFPQG